MEKVNGDIIINGSLAYVSQVSWIQNGTVRDNVLFGSNYNEYAYNKTIESCGLKDDLLSLPAGDATEIGSKGINLSGGQKQRVALCRAVYKNADIYIFDDPLSAVDANVGLHIFNNCINKHLINKTRILVLNQAHLLNHCDYIYALDQGQIVEHGTFNQLINNKQGKVYQLLISYLNSLNQERNNKLTINDLINKKNIINEIMESKQANKHSKGTSTTITNNNNKKKKDAMNITYKTNGPIMNTNDIDDNARIISKEEIFEGRVSWKTYFTHLKKMGKYKYLPYFIIALILQQLLALYPTFFYGSWAKNSYQEDDTFYILNLTYVMIALIIVLLARGISWAYSTITAGIHYHNNALSSILHAPNTFYDTTPIGRILNRFADDINALDTSLPLALLFVFIMVTYVIGTLISVAVANPLFIIGAFIAMLAFSFIQRRYATAAIALQRLENVTRSPVYDHFSETLLGLSTIRAFNIKEQFITDNITKLNVYIQTSFLYKILFHWVRMRTSLLQASLILIATLLIVHRADHLSPQLAGAALVLIIAFGGLLNFLVQQLTTAQSKLNIVERLEYYSNEIEQEPNWYSNNLQQLNLKNWPSKGIIEFKNVSMKYRNNLEPAITNLNFIINSHEKIGIAGRTGSGKSTIMLCLLRMYELSQGQILIDNIDISTIGLHDLRQKIAIIPQDPVIFSGTIRSNLDPFNDYTDQEIWNGLKEVNLDEYVAKLDDNLDAQVLEYGSNLSVGQRQLLCIVRVLLKKPQILLMDEATSSIDQKTDILIQNIVKEKFKNATIITIAHRLNTIMDSDKILILDQGQIKEFDSAQNLLKINNGLFKTMYDNTINQ